MKGERKWDFPQQTFLGATRTYRNGNFEQFFVISSIFLYIYLRSTPPFQLFPTKKSLQVALYADISKILLVDGSNLIFFRNNSLCFSFSDDEVRQAEFVSECNNKITHDWIWFNKLLCRFCRYMTTL